MLHHCEHYQQFALPVAQFYTSSGHGAGDAACCWLFFGASWLLWVMLAKCDVWFSTNLELLQRRATWGAWCWLWMRYWGLVGQQGMDQCTDGPDCLRCCECVTLYPAVFAFSCIKKACIGTSLVVQWLRCWAPNPAGPGSIPGPGN